MKMAWRIIFDVKDANPALVLVCILLSSFAEAAGLSSLLPVLTAVSGDGSGKTSWLNDVILGVVSGAGITPSVGNLILVVIGLILLKSMLAFAALAYAGISAARVAIGLRRRLLAALFDARWEYYSSLRSGDAANAVSNDAGRAGDSYLVAAQFIAYVVQGVVFVAAAFLISWKLALLGLTGSAFIMIVFGRFITITKRAGHRQTRQTAKLTIAMLDMLNNIKPVKAMRRQAHLLDSMGNTLMRLKRALMHRELASSGLVQGTDIATAILAGGIGYLAHVVWNTPLPELIVSAIVFLQVISATSKAQKYRQKLSQIESAYSRVVNMTEAAEAQREINAGKAKPEPASTLSFANVNFSRGPRQIISNATFDIPAGTIAVLSGPSGAGKTTLIDLLIGLNRPDSGRILIGADPLETIDLWAWRKMIGYVPQELSLLHTSIRENITLGDTSITDADVHAALAQAGAEGFIARLAHGLDTDTGEMGGKLSGGQRQRISLARALVSKPQVLILDEVTSALDPVTEAEIVDNIAGLRGAYTIIAVTHRPAWVEIADRLYTVADGQVTLSTELVAGQAKV